MRLLDLRIFDLDMQIVIRDKSDQAGKDDGDALRQAASNLRLSPSLFPPPPAGQPRAAAKPAMEGGMLTPLPVLSSTEGERTLRAQMRMRCMVGKEPSNDNIDESFVAGRSPLPEDLFSSPAFATESKRSGESGLRGQSSSDSASLPAQASAVRTSNDSGPEAGTQKGVSSTEKASSLHIRENRRHARSHS